MDWAGQASHQSLGVCFCGCAAKRCAQQPYARTHKKVNTGSPGCTLASTGSTLVVIYRKNIDLFCGYLRSCLNVAE